MKGAYPTFIKQVGKDFLVYVPDWDNCTSGESSARCNSKTFES